MIFCSDTLQLHSVDYVSKTETYIIEKMFSDFGKEPEDDLDRES